MRKPTSVVNMNAQMRVITLPGRRQVTIGEYVRSWRALKTMRPSAQVAGWDVWPTSAADILRDIAYGVMDRVNIRGGLVLGKPMSAGRIRRNLERTVKSECRWCGTGLGEYRPEHSRFCDASCCSAYCS